MATASELNTPQQRQTASSYVHLVAAMEQLCGRAKTTKTDIFSDPSHRMLQRPPAVKSGEGLGFQDFGSSFDPPKRPVTYDKPSKSKFKPVATLHNKSRKAPPQISEDESDDELLLSSQNSLGSNATSPSRRAGKGKKPDASSDAEETVRVDGRVLTAHPHYKPSSANALKGIRFRKNAPFGDAVAEISLQSPSLINSRELFKPISDDISILDGPPSNGSSSSWQRASETSSARRKSPAVIHVASRPFTDPTDSPITLTVQETRRIPAKPRPRPHPLIKSTSSKRDSSPEHTPRPAVQKHSSSRRSKTPEPPINADSKQSVKKPPFPSPLRREPQEFPMSLRAKENISDGVSGGDVSSTKTKKTVASRAATSVRGLKPMPLPSPLKTKPVSRESTFPNLSPLSSSKHKGKALANSPDGRDILSTSDVRKGGGPKPFPMSSEMLVGINPRSESPSTPSSKSAKHTSSDDSGTEQGRTAKKRKDSRPKILDSLDYLQEPMEDDSIELGYARDPSKICPYCDEELPAYPTPFLQHLLATARSKSVSDPRPRNRRGLKAPLTVYISVCQRHRFESHQLPIATKRGWPKTIDFNKVPIRVKKMKRELEAIILDKDDISDIEDTVTDVGGKGPRRKSVFWSEMKKEVKKQGSRAVVGVKGQFASFEKAQPGYYGEQGSVIIHQTLFDLFPPSTFNASLISPLAPAEFIQRILVPEAAVRLIAQDLCVGIDDAIITLRESAQYGVAMFPDTGENKRKGASVDDDEIGVADQIVMERARARRKELAEEEKVEKEMWEEERAAQRAMARERRREKALERAQQARETKARAEDRVTTEEAESTSEASEASGTRMLQRGAKRRAVTDNDSESDAMSVDSLASGQSTRVAGMGVRRNWDKASRATSQVNNSDSHSKPKASRARKQSTDSETRVTVELVVPRQRKKPGPFGGFISLDGDDEHESTPRPAKMRTTGMTTTEPAVGNLDTCKILPLRVARNRPNAGSSTHDGWVRSLRAPVLNDSGSDSDSDHRSQRVDRPRIKKGRPAAAECSIDSDCPWLFSE